VQVPLAAPPGERALLLIYDKSRSLHVFVDARSPRGAALAKLVRARGAGPGGAGRGQKAYVVAAAARPGELELAVGARGSKLLPPQSWQ
jgi:hypothetical protein